jgi:hypothetical protein
MMPPILLSSVQVATFVSRGFLRFDELLSRADCEAILDEVRSGLHWQEAAYGMPFSRVWPASSALRRVFGSPALAGIVRSLLGADAVYDHHYPHKTRGGQRHSDDLHQDAIFDRRPFAFDVQLALFPQDTPREAGGTLIVPGSHFRRVHESDIRRYQHIKGQQQIVCQAGTVFALHHNLWHSGRSNLSTAGQERVMFKVRLQPGSRQYRTWDLRDLESPEIAAILSATEPWHGADGRMETLNRLELWRELSGSLPNGDIPHFGHYLERARGTNPAVKKDST